jgi:sec-independent protein translocase protein TatB
MLEPGTYVELQAIFSSIGPLEIIAIAAVGLVVLGPEKFPKQAKIAMRMFRDLRGHWDDAKRELTKELKPVQTEFNELKKVDPEKYLDELTADDDDNGGMEDSNIEYGTGEDYGHTEGEYGTDDDWAPDPSPDASSVDQDDTPVEYDPSDDFSDYLDEQEAGEETVTDDAGNTAEGESVEAGAGDEIATSENEPAPAVQTELPDMGDESPRTD